MTSSGATAKQKRAGVPHLLGRAHDFLTQASFQLAIGCLGIIAVVYCYEVVLRYAFNAPTTWANPLVSYLLCALIFLALPEMTRTCAHITINLSIDASARSPVHDPRVPGVRRQGVVALSRVRKSVRRGFAIKLC